jgi:hypothetical protein
MSRDPIERGLEIEQAQLGASSYRPHLQTEVVCDLQRLLSD